MSANRDPRYKTWRWQTLRLRILQRDNHRCMMHDRCETRATQVDHIISPLNGGPFYDPTNLRAACQHHNASAGARAGNLARRRQTTAYPWP